MSRRDPHGGDAPDGPFLETLPTHLHGTPQGYKRNCRCWCCRLANAAYFQGYRRDVVAEQNRRFIEVFGRGTEVTAGSI